MITTIIWILWELNAAGYWHAQAGVWAGGFETRASCIAEADKRTTRGANIYDRVEKDLADRKQQLPAAQYTEQEKSALKLVDRLLSSTCFPHTFNPRPEVKP